MMWWGMVAVLHLGLQLWCVRPVKTAPRGKRTIIGRYPVCPRGCTSCSPVNGCVTCEPRYFMFLYRHNMRQIGLCTPSCPLGYYGVRHQYYSTCNRCGTEHCQACFSRHFCTRCEQPLVAYQGQCVEQCPQGLYYANFSGDCRDRVDCVLGPWTEWSGCTRNGQTCGYKWGQETRTRPTLQPPSPNGQPCPSPRHRSRRCRLAQRWCHDEDDDCRRHKRHKNRLRKHKRKRGRKRKRGKKKNKNKNRRKHNKKASNKNNKNSVQTPDAGQKKTRRKSKNRQRRPCRNRTCRTRNRRRHNSDCRGSSRQRGQM